MTSVTFTQMINPASDAANHSLHLMQARAAVNSIAGAIDTVYTNGAGAVKSLMVRMDCAWTVQMDNLKNVFRITFWTQFGSENLEADIHYKIQRQQLLPFISPGTYTVIIVWSENENISETLQLETNGGLIYIYLNP
ncbi:MAG: hypothetical protein ACPL6F_00575 [Anaerolineales bacterium]